MTRSRRLLVASVAMVVACSGADRTARPRPGGNGSAHAVDGAPTADGSGSEQAGLTDAGSGSGATAVRQVPAAPAPPPPLADADRLPLAGKWHITIRSVQQGDPDGSQYGHYVRISTTGEIFEWLRHELNGGKSAVWKEEATARGSIRQLDAHTLRIQWSPEEPYEYRVRSRDKTSFALGRHWEIKEDPRERATMPYPRPRRGDRNFEDTWTFERKSAPGTRP